MAAAACGRPAFRPVGFNSFAVTIRAVAMKGFSESRDIVFFLHLVTILAAVLISFDVHELSGFIVGRVVTHATASIFEAFHMFFMG